MNDLPETILVAIVILIGAVVVFLGAVWFGRRMLAPPIGRAVDRADTDEEEPGDRPD